MKITELIQYISENIPFHYFANEFPKRATDCAFVRLTGGSEPNRYIPQVKNPSFQIVLRHVNEEEADMMANKIWEHFNGREHTHIGSVRVPLMYCNQSTPVYLGTDNNGRTLYSINVTCKTIG